jgi:hypothetical protein
MNFYHLMANKFLTLAIQLKKFVSWAQWCTSIIPATGEVEIGRIEV